MAVSRIVRTGAAVLVGVGDADAVAHAVVGILRNHVAGRHRTAAVAGVVGDTDQIIAQVVGEAGLPPGGIDGGNTPPTGVVAGAGDPILVDRLAGIDAAIGLPST